MTRQVGVPTLLFATLALFLAPSIVVAGNGFGETTYAALFAEKRPSPAEAASEGYRSVTVDLGSPSLDFEALVPARMEIDVSAKADTLETPGRATLATLAEPKNERALAVTVVAFSPGFAAEAPTAAEQVLFEGGYKLADARHESLVSGQAFGVARTNGEVTRAARSICATREGVVLCFVLEFDAAREAEAMTQIAVFAGSLAFRDGRENAFDEADLAELRLPLGDGGSLDLQRPSAWTVAENDFSAGQSGALQMHHGAADNPFSVLVVTASKGEAPTSPDALEIVARTLVEPYVASNSELIANPRLASTSTVRSAADCASCRSYAFIADKLKGGGQVQLRLTLLAFGGLRYTVMLLTHYSDDIDESGPFFVRWSGTTAEDLAVASILNKRR